MNYIYKRIGLLFLVFIQLCLGLSENKKQVVMVSISTEGFENDILAPIEARVIYAVRESNRYNVIERSELDLILEEHKLSLSGLVKNSSTINPGELIGAQFSIFGKVNNLDDFYTFDFKLINNSSGIIEKTVNLQIPPSITSIINHIPIAIAELVDASSPTTEIREIPVRAIRLGANILSISPLSTFQVHRGPVTAIISNDQIFYSVGKKGEIYEWEFLNNFTHRSVFEYPYWNFVNSSLTASGKHLLVTGTDGVIYLWDTSRWGNPFQLKASGHRITAITISHDDTKLYASNMKGQLDVWDIETQQHLSSAPLLSSNVISLSVNSDDKALISFDNVGSLDLYHLGAEAKIFSENTRQSSGLDLISARAGNSLISVNRMGEMQVWDRSPYSETRFVGNQWLKPGIAWRKTVSLDEGELSAIIYSPTEDILVIGLTNGGILVVDAIDWRVLAKNVQKRAAVTALEFLSDHQFVSGHKDGSLVSWLLN
jgi:hypothetical protein